MKELTQKGKIIKVLVIATSIIAAIIICIVVGMTAYGTGYANGQKDCIQGDIKFELVRDTIQYWQHIKK